MFDALSPIRWFSTSGRIGMLPSPRARKGVLRRSDRWMRTDPPSDTASWPRTPESCEPPVRISDLTNTTCCHKYKFKCKNLLQNKLGNVLGTQQLSRDCSLVSTLLKSLVLFLSLKSQGLGKMCVGYNVYFCTQRLLRATSNSDARPVSCTVCCSNWTDMCPRTLEKLWYKKFYYIHKFFRRFYVRTDVS